ncbi:MAG: hypothetical protein HYZ58_05570, partial [Acidobacteria bacterium]|nr:hypothetical protein [Acidobacteriota bacterium]
WQVAVESAQVIAGIVRYPAGNPFYIYHRKLWTLLNQVCALFLLSGVSEITLSKVLSGVLGMLTFQGWALVVYALSRDAFLAVGSTFVIFLSRVAQFGVVYPISLVDTSDTYGVVGLAVLVLVAGLVGSGQYRAGAFLLAAAPAIHPSLGLWLVVIVALAYAWDVRKWIEEFRRALTWLLAGCALTAVSLLAEMTLIYDAPPADPAFAEKFFSVFIDFWDGHRQPVLMKTIGVAFNVGAFGMAVLWLKFFADDVPRAARLLLRFVAVSAALSVAFGFISWIPHNWLPTWFLILMPARLLNFNAFVFPALLFGLVGVYRDRLWSQAIVIAVSLRLLLSGRSMFWRWLEREGTDSPAVQIRLFWTIAFCCVVLVSAVAASRWWKKRADADPSRKLGVAVRAVRVASLAVCAAAGMISWELADRHATEIRATTFLDRTNDALFASVARGQGLLLTAGDLHLIQLRTRRPVLLDGGGLDGVAYALEAASAMDRIMREVYGVDVFDPPEEARGGGRMPLGANRAAWERYSVEKWQAIARAYSVTQVLTFSDWTLKLPPVAHNRRFTLYAIPD